MTMMRLSLMGLMVIGLTGCKYSKPAVTLPSSVEKTAAGYQDNCADTSIVIRPEKGSFQFGVDPVETQKTILESRTFKKALASSNPQMTDVRYRVNRFEDSAVLSIVIWAESSERALRACHALSRTAIEGVVADSEIVGEKAWLADQRKEIQQRKAAAEQALTSFLAEQKLAVLEPSDQISLFRERLIALNKDKDKTTEKKHSDRMAKAILELETKISEMNMLKLTHDRLKRSVIQETQLLDSFSARETDLVFKTRIAPSLITLDPCAATSCRHTDNE